MDINKIINYFPVQVCTHVNRRDCFIDCGTICGVDIKDWNQEQTNLKFVCQKMLKCPDTDLVLTATGPSMPLLPPNKCSYQF